MKKFLRVIVEVVLDFFIMILCFIRDNLRRAAWMLSMLLPYGMYFIGQLVANHRGEVGVGGELFFPVVVWIIIYVLRSIANKYNKGYTIPIPDKRFTEVDEDGEVSIPNSRIQELILYLADLEDWLERKGLL